MIQVEDHPGAQQQGRDRRDQKVDAPADLPGLDDADEESAQQQGSVAEEVEPEQGAGGVEIRVPEYAAREAEHELVQIVGQGAEGQQGCRCGHSPGPAGQRLRSGPPDRQGAEEEHQGRRNEGNVVTIPVIAGEDRAVEVHTAPEELHRQEQQQGSCRAEDQPLEPAVRDPGLDLYGPDQQQGPGEELGKAIQQVPLIGQHPQEPAEHKDAREQRRPEGPFSQPHIVSPRSLGRPSNMYILSNSIPL